MTEVKTTTQQQVVKLFANSFLGKAVTLLSKKPKALAFLGFVVARFSEVGAKQGLASFKGMVRMLRASVSGAYPNLPWRTAVALVGGLLYLVAPIDILPDFIPVLGFADDAFLLGKIFKLAEDDLRDFRAWERSKIHPHLADLHTE